MITALPQVQSQTQVESRSASQVIALANRFPCVNAYVMYDICHPPGLK